MKMLIIKGKLKSIPRSTKLKFNLGAYTLYLFDRPSYQHYQTPIFTNSHITSIARKDHGQLVILQ